jgi:quercetin dioxygenase-like cupin family protein
MKIMIRFALLTSILALTLSFSLHAEPPKTAQPDYNNDVRVTPLFRSTTNFAGQTIVYPHEHQAEVSILIITIAPGKQTGWHLHPVPLFGYVLSGEVTVTIEGHGKQTFHEGDPLAECVNILHNGVNEGKIPTKLLIFVAGEKTVPFTVKQKKE